MRLKNNKSGFTLLEIIIVIIIVGVLASLALPRFFNTIEFSRSSEALNSLGTLKRAADRCAMMAGAVTGVPADYSNCSTLAQLGIDDPGLSPGASFTYAMSYAVGPPEVWSGVATRNASTDTITLTYNITAGTVTRAGTGAYASLQ